MANLKMRSRVVGFCGAAAFLLSTVAGLGGAAAATVTIQRTHIYINTLPSGCVKTTYNNHEVVVWRCGKLYYQPYNGRYVRVYIIT
jgi:hypothetical protein